METAKLPSVGGNVTVMCYKRKHWSDNGLSPVRRQGIVWTRYSKIKQTQTVGLLLSWIIKRLLIIEFSKYYACSPRIALNLPPEITLRQGLKYINLAAWCCFIMHALWNPTLFSLHGLNIPSPYWTITCITDLFRWNNSSKAQTMYMGHGLPSLW